MFLNGLSRKYSGACMCVSPGALGGDDSNCKVFHYLILYVPLVE